MFAYDGAGQGAAEIVVASSHGNDHKDGPDHDDREHDDKKDG